MTSILYMGDTLAKGASIYSPGQRYQLTLQTDGNLVIYDSGKNGQAIWSSRTNGKAVNHAIMQTDGNFVIYGFPQALWATNTSAITSATLELQDDGNLVVYESYSAAVWTS